MDDSQKFSGEDWANVAKGFEEVGKHIRNLDDKSDIVAGIAASVLAQEITRMVITKNKMTNEMKSDIDKDYLIAYWRVLAHHYRGAKHQEIFKNGLKQLEKLTSEETKNVIHDIRRSIQPTLNREMEEKVVKIGLDIPLLGKIGLGKLKWTVRGPRVSVRRFQVRLFRLFVESVVWLSVLLGTIHWFMWTIFKNPYLVQEFEGTMKFVQFVLLVPTTIIVWVLGRGDGPRFVHKDRKFTRSSIRIGGWSLVVGGWSYWIAWVLLDVTNELLVLEPLGKIAFPFFLVSGCLAGWLLGRVSKRD